MDKKIAKIWLMIASDKADTFRWEHIMDGSTVRWNMRNVMRNFKNARKGDIILCYRGGSPNNALVGIAVVVEEFFEESIVIRGVFPFEKEILYDEYKNTWAYQSTQAGRMRNRGTMFEVSEEFVQWVINRLTELGDEKSARVLQSGTFSFDF